MTIRPTFTFLLFGVAAFGSATAKADGPAFPTLERNGIVYQSACAGSSLQELKESLAAIKVKAHTQAWKGVHTLLCGARTEANKRYIASILAPKIRTSVELTGQDSHVDNVKNNKSMVTNLFAAGVAFNARIADKPNELELYYYSNEACVESRTFRYVGNRWLIVSISEGCD